MARRPGVSVLGDMLSSKEQYDWLFGYADIIDKLKAKDTGVLGILRRHDKHNKMFSTDGRLLSSYRASDLKELIYSAKNELGMERITAQQFSIVTNYAKTKADGTSLDSLSPSPTKVDQLYREYITARDANTDKARSATVEAKKEYKDNKKALSKARRGSWLAWITTIVTTIGLASGVGALGYGAFAGITSALAGAGIASAGVVVGIGVTLIAGRWIIKGLAKIYGKLGKWIKDKSTARKSAKEAFKKSEEKYKSAEAVHESARMQTISDEKARYRGVEPVIETSIELGDELEDLVIRTADMESTADLKALLTKAEDLSEAEKTALKGRISALSDADLKTQLEALAEGERTKAVERINEAMEEEKVTYASGTFTVKALSSGPRDEEERREDRKPDPKEVFIANFENSDYYKDYIGNAFDGEEEKETIVRKMAENVYNKSNKGKNTLKPDEIFKIANQTIAEVYPDEVIGEAEGGTKVKKPNSKKGPLLDKIQKQNDNYTQKVNQDKFDKSEAELGKGVEILKKWALYNGYEVDEAKVEEMKNTGEVDGVKLDYDKYYDRQAEVFAKLVKNPGSEKPEDIQRKVEAEFYASGVAWGLENRPITEDVKTSYKAILGKDVDLSNPQAREALVRAIRQVYINHPELNVDSEPVSWRNKNVGEVFDQEYSALNLDTLKAKLIASLDKKDASGNHIHDVEQRQIASDYLNMLHNEYGDSEDFIKQFKKDFAGRTDYENIYDALRSCEFYNEDINNILNKGTLPLVPNEKRDKYNRYIEHLIRKEYTELYDRIMSDTKGDDPLKKIKNYVKSLKKLDLDVLDKSKEEIENNIVEVGVRKRIAQMIENKWDETTARTIINGTAPLAGGPKGELAQYYAFLKNAVKEKYITEDKIIELFNEEKAKEPLDEKPLENDYTDAINQALAGNYNALIEKILNDPKHTFEMIRSEDNKIDRKATLERFAEHAVEQKWITEDEKQKLVEEFPEEEHNEHNEKDEELKNMYAETIEKIVNAGYSDLDLEVIDTGYRKIDGNTELSGDIDERLTTILKALGRTGDLDNIKKKFEIMPYYHNLLVFNNKINEALANSDKKSFDENMTLFANNLNKLETLLPDVSSYEQRYNEFKTRGEEAFKNKEEDEHNEEDEELKNKYTAIIDNIANAEYSEEAVEEILEEYNNINKEEELSGDFISRLTAMLDKIDRKDELDDIVKKCRYASAVNSIQEVGKEILENIKNPKADLGQIEEQLGELKLDIDELRKIDEASSSYDEFNKDYEDLKKQVEEKKNKEPETDKENNKKDTAQEFIDDIEKKAEKAKEVKDYDALIAEIEEYKKSDNYKKASQSDKMKLGRVKGAFEKEKARLNPSEAKTNKGSPKTNRKPKTPPKENENNENEEKVTSDSVINAFVNTLDSEIKSCESQPAEYLVPLTKVFLSRIKDWKKSNDYYEKCSAESREKLDNLEKRITEMNEQANNALKEKANKSGKASDYNAIKAKIESLEKFVKDAKDPDAKVTPLLQDRIDQDKEKIEESIEKANLTKAEKENLKKLLNELDTNTKVITNTNKNEEEPEL